LCVSPVKINDILKKITLIFQMVIFKIGGGGGNHIDYLSH